MLWRVTGNSARVLGRRKFRRRHGPSWFKLTPIGLSRFCLSSITKADRLVIAQKKSGNFAGPCRTVASF